MRRPSTSPTAVGPAAVATAAAGGVTVSRADAGDGQALGLEGRHHAGADDVGPAQDRDGLRAEATERVERAGREGVAGGEQHRRRAHAGQVAAGQRVGRSRAVAEQRVRRRAEGLQRDLGGGAEAVRTGKALEEQGGLGAGRDGPVGQARRDRAVLLDVLDEQVQVVEAAVEAVGPVGEGAEVVTAAGQEGVHRDAVLPGQVQG